MGSDKQRRYLVDTCLAAMRHAGHWITLDGVPRTDKARERLKRIAPALLREHNLGGVFVFHELGNKTVVAHFGQPILRVVYSPKKMTREAQGWAIIRDRRTFTAALDAKAPPRSDGPAREHQQNAVGHGDHTHDDLEGVNP
jgi:hypothetical protein